MYIFVIDPVDAKYILEYCIVIKIFFIKYYYCLSLHSWEHWAPIIWKAYKKLESTRRSPLNNFELSKMGNRYGILL